MYWQQAADCRNSVATNFMTRDRFDEIMCYFHLADNNQLNKEDKFAKLRPRFDNLNRSFLARFCSETRLSIDESMVPYFGHHGCKQFIRGKPIRFGYKIWCLNTMLGYPIQFQAYQGKGSVTRPELGLGGARLCWIWSRTFWWDRSTDCISTTSLSHSTCSTTSRHAVSELLVPCAQTTPTDVHWYHQVRRRRIVATSTTAMTSVEKQALS